MRNTLVIFAYETEDNSKGCQYWETYVTVESEEFLDIAALEDLIMSYMESDISDYKEYSEMTEEIMNESGYTWRFFTTPETIHTASIIWI